VRSEESVAALLDGGAQWVVMATAAVRDPHLFERCAFGHPGRILAALDVRDNKAAVSGWLDTDPVVLKALVGRWADLPLAGVILACIDRDGAKPSPCNTAITSGSRCVRRLERCSRSTTTRAWPSTCPFIEVTGS